LDPECTVEFSDFAATVGESPLLDGQMFYIGEYSATVMHGETLSLIAISKGRPGQEELQWSKGVLSAMEGYMVVRGHAPSGKGETPEQKPAEEVREEEKGEEKKEEKGEEPPLPLPPTPPSLPPDDNMSEREAGLLLRERELADAEEKAWKAIVRESEMRIELEDLRQTLIEVESQAKIDRRRLERELEKLKDELKESAKN
jgi:hypothetical protein